MKNLFSSTTVWGAILACWLAISPNIKDIIKNGLSADNSIDLVDNIVASMVIIIGRYNSNVQLFTPKGFIGRDKK